MLHNKANTSPKSYAQGLFCISEEERMERGKKPTWKRTEVDICNNSCNWQKSTLF